MTGAPEDEIARYFSRSNTLFCLCGFDGVLARLNDAWTTVLGYTLAELESEPFLSFVHPDDRLGTAEVFARIGEGEPVPGFENRYRAKDGSFRSLLWSVNPVFDRKVIYATALDVTERRRLADALEAKTAQLEAKNAEIEHASRLRADFLANMSHELRTPLNGVIGFAQLLLEGEDELTPTQHGYVEEMARSGRRLLGAIDGILDYVRIDAGRLTLTRVPVAAHAAVQEALAPVQPQASEKRIEISVENRTARAALADRARLAQVLRNLLSNAVKLGSEGTRIEVVLEDAGAFVRFSIVDQGAEASGPRLSQLFQAFVQGENALVKRHEGVGLGLALAKRLVELHGGTIDVASGSLFAFTIPATEAPAPGPASAPDRGELEVATGAPTARRVPLHAKPASPPRPKVLVVDDTEGMRSLVQAMLEPLGFHVLVAPDGAVGVEIARRERPALVFMDLAMPVKDGFAATRELKADPRTRAIPVVAFSTLTVDSDARLQDAGFDGYVGKPFDRQTLQEVIAAFLASPAPAAELE